MKITIPKEIFGVCVWGDNFMPTLKRRDAKDVSTIC